MPVPIHVLAPMLKRPRGLLSSRNFAGRHVKQLVVAHVPENTYPASSRSSATDSDQDYDDHVKPDFHVPKRRRTDSPESTQSDSESDIQYWDYSRRISPCSQNNGIAPRRRLKAIDTTSTATRGKPPSRMDCDYEDWEDLKDLFGKAVEQYEGESSSSRRLVSRNVDSSCNLQGTIYQKHYHSFAASSTNAIVFFSVIQTLQYCSRIHLIITRALHRILSLHKASVFPVTGSMLQNPKSHYMVLLKGQDHSLSLYHSTSVFIAKQVL